MGFRLNCLFAVDRDMLGLYELLAAGGSRWATAVHGEGLPNGWVLPTPWELEFALDKEAVQVAEFWTPTATSDAWRRAAGVPAQPDPLGAFDDLDLQCAALLSLAATSGVVFINDETFGGVLGHEYTATFVAGRLRAACGVDFLSGQVFELRNQRYHTVAPATVQPVSACAAVLDARFADVSPFDGYLPRDACDTTLGEPAPAAVTQTALDAQVTNKWGPFFPILTQ